MTTSQFINLRVGDKIYSEGKGIIRDVYRAVDQDVYTEDSIPDDHKIFTRNSLLLGSAAYDNDWLDIPFNEREYWEVYKNFDWVRNMELKMNILAYEQRKTQWVLAHVAAVNHPFNQFI